MDLIDFSIGICMPSSSQPAPEDVMDPEKSREDERRAAMRERRRKTIEELVETETSYARDLAVVEEIFLARARGVGKLTAPRRRLSSR